MLNANEMRRLLNEERLCLLSGMTRAEVHAISFTGYADADIDVEVLLRALRAARGGHEGDTAEQVEARAIATRHIYMNPSKLLASRDLIRERNGEQEYAWMGIWKPRREDSSRWVCEYGYSWMRDERTIAASGRDPVMALKDALASLDLDVELQRQAGVRFFYREFGAKGEEWTRDSELCFAFHSENGVAA